MSVVDCIFRFADFVILQLLFFKFFIIIILNENIYNIYKRSKIE